MILIVDALPYLLTYLACNGYCSIFYERYRHFFDLMISDRDKCYIKSLANDMNFNCFLFLCRLILSETHKFNNQTKSRIFNTTFGFNDV